MYAVWDWIVCFRNFCTVAGADCACYKFPLLKVGRGTICQKRGWLTQFNSTYPFHGLSSFHDKYKIRIWNGARKGNLLSKMGKEGEASSLHIIVHKKAAKRIKRGEPSSLWPPWESLASLCHQTLDSQPLAHFFQKRGSVHSTCNMVATKCY